MLFLLGYNLKIYLLQGEGIDIWWEEIFLSGGGMNKYVAGGERTPPALTSSPSRKNPDLHSSLRFFLFQGNLYSMFVILDIKFPVASIKWNLCQNTVKFQNMTSLADKICTNIQTSMRYYLLNWVLASMCSCSQKSWILFTLSTCRAVVHSFQNIIWIAMTLLFTATILFTCVYGRYDSIWYYLNWTLVLIFTKKISFCPES